MQWTIHAEVSSIDHITEPLGRFESMVMLDASPSERYNVHVQQVYRNLSQRPANR